MSVATLQSRALQGTFKKIYKMRTIKFGTLIGEDELGNKYYENTKVRAQAAAPTVATIVLSAGTWNSTVNAALPSAHSPARRTTL